MSDDNVKTEAEISNVDLQFMGETNAKRERDLTIKAESHAAAIADRPEVDKVDITSAQSMDASDPPSTNMGDADADDSDDKQQ